MVQDPNTNDFCDVSEFFHSITQMTIQKYIIVETNEVYYFLTALPTNIRVWLSEKMFVTSKLRDVLDKNQLYLKPAIASKSRSQKLAELYQRLSAYAQNHVQYVSRNPGFHMIQPTKIMFFSTENSPFIQHSHINVPIEYSNTTLPVTLNQKFNVYSVEAAFLIVMRCLSMFMSLNTQTHDFPFNFPYLLVFNYRELNPIFFSTVKSYLCAFNRYMTNIPDINMSFKELENQISQYRSNFLLLNAMTDAGTLRDENLHLLRDHYINTNAYNLCAIVSNTIQAKIDRNEYLELNLENILPLDTAELQRELCRFDYNFISTVIHYSFEKMHSHFTESYNRHLSIISHQCSQIKLQKTYATLLAVKDFVAEMASSETSVYFGKEFETFVLKLLQADTKQSSDNTVVKMFRSKLETHLRTGQLRLLQNSKTNQELLPNSAIPCIYHENRTLLLPADLFDQFCSTTPLLVKQALYKQGYLNFSNQLYINKKIIYAPGNAGKRIDVYILNDDLIDEEILEQLIAKNRLHLSKIRTSQSSVSGVIIGNGIHENPIIWNYNHPLMPNAHLFVTGRSGTGKTTCIVQTLQELCNRGEQAVIFDISNSYLHHPGLANCSKSYEDIFPVNPLHAYPNESMEACCQRVTDNLASIFRLNDKNYYILLDAISEMYQDDKIDVEFAHLAYDLIDENKTVEAVLQFIEDFRGESTTWDQILTSNKASIFSMKQPHTPYEKTTEFLLNDLYSYFEYKQNSERTKDKVFVVVDEIQNMIYSETAAILRILSQGREKGLALISATQSFLSIPRRYKSMFLQSGLNIFFQPEITAAESTAKYINGGNSIPQVTEALKKLSIAECLVYGAIENTQHHMIMDTLLYCNCNLEQPAEETCIPEIPTFSVPMQKDEYVINMEFKYSL